MHHQQSMDRYQRAVAALQAGDPISAICHIEPAIAAAPDFLDGRNVLGVAFKRCRRFSDAILQFEHVLRIDPRHPSAHNNIASTHIASGDLVRAESALHEIIAAGAQTAEPFGNLAAIHEKANRIDAASSAARQGLSLESDNCHCRLILARCLRRMGQLEEARQVIQQVSTTDLDGQLAGNVLFEHARILDRLDQSAEAFQRFEAANRLSAASFREAGIDGATYIQELDELLAMLELVNQDESPARVTKQRPSTRPDPIFLVGFPRSGTTLLGNILDAHPQCTTFEETPAFESVINQLRQLPDGYPPSLLAIDNDDREYLQRIYFSVLDSMQPVVAISESDLKPHSKPDSPQVWIDQYPFNTANVWPILTVFPRAKFLFALRHPCDVCLSCLMQEFQPNRVTANLCSLDEAATAYARTMTVWLESIRRLTPMVHTVRYEDVVADFDRTISGVLEFLGIDWNDAVQQFARHARQRLGLRTASYHQVTEPLYQRASGRWFRYQDAMRQTASRLRPFINEFGYQ
ncbi:MAG: sulfotransferase [Planctomycetota bacterium]|nr:sulfotransferase [Planctomycetota bacterium]